MKRGSFIMLAGGAAAWPSGRPIHGDRKRSQLASRTFGTVPQGHQAR
jgi:hypothetical protein